MVCSGGSINYVSPFYAMHDLPEGTGIGPLTLRNYLDDVRCCMKPDDGVRCVIRGIAELNPIEVILYAPTGLAQRVPVTDWQRAIAMREQHVLHLPWALGCSTDLKGANGPLYALSLQNLGFTTAPDRKAYGERTANGWYLSHATHDGYGIITADPSGGATAAFVHWRHSGHELWLPDEIGRAHV